MQDDGDSSGAYEDQSVDVAEVGAEPNDDAQTSQPEAVETFDKQKILSMAEMAGIDVESNDFKDLASQITTKREIDDMTPEELNLLGQTLSGRALDAQAASDEKEAAQVDEALAKNTVNKSLLRSKIWMPTLKLLLSKAVVHHSATVSCSRTWLLSYSLTVCFGKQQPRVGPQECLRKTT